MHVRAVATVLRVPGLSGLGGVRSRLDRRAATVRRIAGIPLQLGVRGVAIMHLSHARFGECRSEGEKQEDGNEASQVHAVTGQGVENEAECGRPEASYGASRLILYV